MCVLQLDPSEPPEMDMGCSRIRIDNIDVWGNSLRPGPLRSGNSVVARQRPKGVVVRQRPKATLSPGVVRGLPMNTPDTLVDSPDCVTISDDERMASPDAAATDEIDILA